MRQVGDAVGRAHDAPLQGLRQVRPRVIDDAILDLVRQVQPLAALLEKLDDAQALLVVGEVARKLRHHRLARMSKRRVADIVADGDGLNEVLVEAQSARNGPRDLRDF